MATVSLATPTLAFKHPSPRKRQYGVKAAVAGCIDTRFALAQNALLESYGLNSENADIIRVAGGGAYGKILKHIITSLRIHQVPEADLWDHVDCGALDGSERFGGLAKEILFHEDLLRRRKIAIEYAAEQSLAHWRTNGVKIAEGKFLAPQLVKKMYPEKLTVRIGLFTFEGFIEFN